MPEPRYGEQSVLDPSLVLVWQYVGEAARLDKGDAFLLTENHPGPTPKTTPVQCILLPH